MNQLAFVTQQPQTLKHWLMEVWVYILYSHSLDTFYKGISKNVDRRLSQHNAGYEEYTRLGAPWILLWCAKKSNKSEAYRLERKLKNLSRKRLIRFMLKYDSQVSSLDALQLLLQWSRS